MVGITQSHAEAQLQAWLDAEAKLNQIGSHSISTGGGSRTLERRDLAEVREQIDYWERRAKRLARGGVRMGRLVQGG